MLACRQKPSVLLVSVLLIVSTGAGIVSAALSPDEKKSVLDLHNVLRQRIAYGQATDKSGKALPSAADMSGMYWDDTVANTAQAFVNGCPSGHDPNNKLYGENMAWGSAGFYTPAMLVQMWYDELTNKPGYLACDPEKFTMDCFNTGIGHFSQLAWANSWKLGCGSAICNGMLELVCRYFNRGNMINSKIYTKGTACTKCGPQQQCNDNGLCWGPLGARPLEPIVEESLYFPFYNETMMMQSEVRIL